MHDQPKPEPDDDTAEDEELSAADQMVEDKAIDIEGRLWLHALVPVLQLARPSKDEPEVIRLAAVRLYTAAANRAARILRSDMIDDPD